MAFAALFALLLIVGILAGIAWLAVAAFGKLSELAGSIRRNAAWIGPSAGAYLAIGYFNSDYTLDAGVRDPFVRPDGWQALLDCAGAIVAWPYNYLARQPGNGVLLLLLFGCIVAAFVALPGVIERHERGVAKLQAELAAAKRSLARQEEAARDAGKAASREERRLHGIMATRDAELAQLRERERLLLFERGVHASPQPLDEPPMQLLPPASASAIDDIAEFYGE